MSLNVKAVEETFARIRLSSTAFSSLFYSNLLADFPQLIPLFANTNMQEQEKKLMMSLMLVINNLRNLAYLRILLKDLGERHVRYGVVQEHYPMVGAALLKTLGYFLQEDWTQEVKQAWSDAYEAIVAIMLEGAQPEPIGFLTNSSLPSQAIDSSARFSNAQKLFFGEDKAKNQLSSYEITGLNGYIILSKTHVLISKEIIPGFLKQELQDNQEIQIKYIKSAKLIPPSDLEDGCLRFSLLGNIEQSIHFLDAKKDKNTIFFSAEQKSDFEELKDYVNSVINGENRDWSNLKFSPATITLSLIRQNGHLPQDFSGEILKTNRFKVAEYIVNLLGRNECFIDIINVKYQWKILSFLILTSKRLICFSISNIPGELKVDFDIELNQVSKIVATEDSIKIHEKESESVVSFKDEVTKKLAKEFIDCNLSVFCKIEQRYSF